MGLMYMLPVSKEETDRLEINNNRLILKSYGLPLVFWGYFLAITSIIGVMYIIIKGPLNLLAKNANLVDFVLLYSVYFIMIFIPLFILTALFYEKWLIKDGNKITICHRFFFLPLFKKSMTQCDLETQLVIEHLLDSPNIAKMKQSPDLKGFENRGYYQLFLNNENGKKILLDRHSRKSDLIKIKQLLTQF